MAVQKPDSLEKWLFFLWLAQAVCLAVCAFCTVAICVDQHLQIDLYQYVPTFLIFVFALPHFAAMLSRCFYLPYLCFAGLLALTVICGGRRFRSRTRPPVGWILCFLLFLFVSILGMLSVEHMFAVVMSV